MDGIDRWIDEIVGGLAWIDNKDRWQ